MKRYFLAILLSITAPTIVAHSGFVESRIESTIVGTWQWIAVKYPGDSVYSPSPPNYYLHVTQTEIIEWGPYACGDTYIVVFWNTGQPGSVGYTRYGNSLTFVFHDGTVWKLAKTS
jgi:hypothetical protein